MSTLAELLILKVGGRITKILVESWAGKGSTTALGGDVVDVLATRFQSVLDQKRAGAGKPRPYTERGSFWQGGLTPLAP